MRMVWVFVYISSIVFEFFKLRMIIIVRQLAAALKSIFNEIGQECEIIIFAVLIEL